MRHPLLMLCLCFMICCAAQAKPEQWRISMQDGDKVRDHLKYSIHEKIEAGPLGEGTAVYDLDTDQAFWVLGETIYAVNARARDAAPDLPQAPENITYTAVYDASCDSRLTRSVRPAKITMTGFHLGDKKAEEYETFLQSHPDDVWMRTLMIGYYSLQRFDSEEANHRWEQHVLWLVENAPENPVVGGETRLDNDLNPKAYPKAAAILKEHVEKNPDNVYILSNAADFFLINEKDYAIECLNKCIALEPNEPFWKKELEHAESLKSYATSLSGREGIDPELFAKVAGIEMPIPGRPKPLININFRMPMLQLIDTVFGLPLLALLLCVLLVSVLSSRQHLFMLLPLGFVYLAPLALTITLPTLTESLFGMDGFTFQHLLSTYFGSLALVWILSDMLAKMRGLAAILAAIAILAVGGVFGLPNYPHAYHMIAEMVTFIIVITGSFLMTRLCCYRRPSAVLLLVCFFLFNVVLMLVTWPLMWMTLLRSLLGMDLLMAAVRLPQTIRIAFIDGIGLFVFLLPFLLVALYVPFYRTQLNLLMGWPEPPPLPLPETAMGQNNG